MKKIVVCMGIATFVFVFFSLYRSSYYEIVPVVSMSVTNKVIVVDAGHGVPDERSG